MAILVTGATGNNGRAVLGASLARGLPVRAAIHDERSDVPAGVGRVRFDFADPATWDAALAGATGVFS